MQSIFRHLLISAFALSSVFQASSQTSLGLVALYSFDGCDAADDTGNAPSGVIGGDPACGCGVQGNALYFDGVDDYIEFLGNLDLLLSDEFTASFFMSPENTSGIVDLFSKREQCSPDSAVAIRLEPAQGLIRAELTEGINERAENRASVPADRCWLHVAWVRTNSALRLYIDGVQVDMVEAGSDIAAQNNGIFSLANSPCLANAESRFRGAVDELRLYNRALSAAEIQELVVPFDRIENRDTVIFQGSGVQVRLPRSCAMEFGWFPPETAMGPMDQEPLLIPDETTTYEVSMNYGFCVASDSLRVIVVDSNDLSCEDVFLPRAFTPNNDGLNDTYGLSNADFFLGEFISLQIFDRWGSMVFEGTSIDQEWDGTYRGSSLMPGMFIYKVRFRCNGEEKVTANTFNLLK